MTAVKPRLVIARLGDTTPLLSETKGPFEAWILRRLERADLDVSILTPYRDATPLPDPACCEGVILTGSGAMVTHREDWMLRCMAWVRELVATQTALLAICFGHQLLASAHGGRVEDNPDGPEVGTMAVTPSAAARQDRLFSSLNPPLRFQVSHLQSVTKLPREAIRLATTARDPNHAFRLGTNAWGVQFHPEFDVEATTAYLERHAERLLRDGQDPAQLKRQVRPCPHGAQILHRFGQFLGEKNRAF